MDPVTIALVALLGFPIGVLLFAAYECSLPPRMRGRNDRRLRLREIIAARGLVVPPIKGAAARHAAALAIFRCRACGHEPSCDRFASARNWSALDAICPNTSFLGTLQRRPILM
jgi:hypothetical protein